MANANTDQYLPDSKQYADERFKSPLTQESGGSTIPRMWPSWLAWTRASTSRT